MNTMNQTELFTAFANANPGVESFNRQDMYAFAETVGAKRGTATGLMKKCEKGGYGVYKMSLGTAKIIPMSQPNPIANVVQQATKQVQSTVNSEVFIPQKEAEFVKWGYFSDVKKIIESRMFFPMFVAGLSGNGKTMMVEQACANAKREYVRVQITPETDEDDLIGGFRLLDGETVFAKGPVIKAMEAGAILLIDEIDRGSNKLMALQGVLEGKPVMIKKTGEMVYPASGFNVIATANTKGQGDEQGRFIAATIIDEAFLERFTITLEQPYATAAVEKRIVNNHMTKFGANDTEFAEKLVQWGQAIRKTFEDGGVDEIISTRRLCHIVQTFSIFGDRMKAIELCVNRFDTDTRGAFIDLYTKIDTGAYQTDDVPTPTDEDFIDNMDSTSF